MFGIDDLAVGAASGLVGGALNWLGGNQANQAAAAAAQKQMDFQASQSSTQYQRATADLKAAGLNPILAATGGMSEGSMPGASYTPQNALSGVGGSVSTAVQAASQSAELRTQQAQIRQMIAGANQSDAAAQSAWANAYKTNLEAGNVGTAGKLMAAQSAAASASARFNSMQADIAAPRARVGASGSSILGWGQTLGSMLGGSGMGGAVGNAAASAVAP